MTERPIVLHQSRPNRVVHGQRSDGYTFAYCGVSMMAPVWEEYQRTWWGIESQVTCRRCISIMRKRQI